MEGARVLCDGVELASKSAKGSAIDTVTVASSHDIWSGLVDCRVYHEGGSIKKAILSSFQDLRLLVHSNEIRGIDQGESSAERIDPEGIWFDWIPQSDVASDTLFEAELAKDTKGSC